jgi:hypothetical protein
MLQLGGFSLFLYYCTVSLFTMFTIQEWKREVSQVHVVIVMDLTCSQVLTDSGVPSLSQSPNSCVKELDSVKELCELLAAF